MAESTGFQWKSFAVRLGILVLLVGGVITYLKITQPTSKEALFGKVPNPVPAIPAYDPGRLQPEQYKPLETDAKGTGNTRLMSWTFTSFMDNLRPILHIREAPLMIEALYQGVWLELEGTVDFIEPNMETMYACHVVPGDKSEGGITWTETNPARIEILKKLKSGDKVTLHGNVINISGDNLDLQMTNVIVLENGRDPLARKTEKLYTSDPFPDTPLPGQDQNFVYPDIGLVEAPAVSVSDLIRKAPVWHITVAAKSPKGGKTIWPWGTYVRVQLFKSRPTAPNTPNFPSLIFDRVLQVNAMYEDFPFGIPGPQLDEKYQEKIPSSWVGITVWHPSAPGYYRAWLSSEAVKFPSP